MLSLFYAFISRNRNFKIFKISHFSDFIDLFKISIFRPLLLCEPWSSVWWTSTETLDWRPGNSSRMSGCRTSLTSPRRTRWWLSWPSTRKSAPTTGWELKFCFKQDFSQNYFLYFSFTRQLTINTLIQRLHFTHFWNLASFFLYSLISKIELKCQFPWKKNKRYANLLIFQHLQMEETEGEYLYYSRRTSMDELSECGHGGSQDGEFVFRRSYSWFFRL